MTQINYYSLLREKIMEDSECKKSLEGGETLFRYNNVLSAKEEREIYGEVENDLTINHILAYCKNKRTNVNFRRDKMFLSADFNGKLKVLEIDFLKNLSEQQKACKSILDFLNK